DENNSEGKQECLNITIVCNEIKNLAKPYYTWLARFFACEKLSKTGLYHKKEKYQRCFLNKMLLFTVIKKTGKGTLCLHIRTFTCFLNTAKKLC
ncbi:MAG: hypothetical protein IKO61_12410, partial [Lachnospiraceae bacterium]|nr:hypothetical protein [Lachnospiraceae bacterium]